MIMLVGNLGEYFTCLPVDRPAIMNTRTFSSKPDSIGLDIYLEVDRKAPANIGDVEQSLNISSQITQLSDERLAVYI